MVDEQRIRPGMNVVRRGFASVFVTGTVLLLAACGGPSEEQKQAAETARKNADEAKVRADKAVAQAEKCRDQIGPYIKVLSDLNNRLAVGMNFSDYSSSVGDISVAYGHIPIGKMELACIGGPGVAAESAGTAFEDAYDNWNECISNVLSCDMDAVEPELQQKWSKAARKISTAKRELASIEGEASAAQAELKKAEQEADEAEAELE